MSGPLCCVIPPCPIGLEIPGRFRVGGSPLGGDGARPTPSMPPPPPVLLEHSAQHASQLPVRSRGTASNPHEPPSQPPSSEMYAPGRAPEGAAGAYAVAEPMVIAVGSTFPRWSRVFLRP